MLAEFNAEAVKWTSVETMQKTFDHELSERADQAV